MLTRQINDDGDNDDDGDDDDDDEYQAFMEAKQH